MKESYKSFLKSLKDKYGDGYLALATISEQEEFVKLFASCGLSLDKAYEFMEKAIIIQKNNLFYKPYLDYQKTLEDRYGRYYFSMMNQAEQAKLINLYTKYMQNKKRGYTKEDAFLELYYAELSKYQKDSDKVAEAIKKMHSMIIVKQIDITDLDSEKNVK